MQNGSATSIVCNSDLSLAGGIRPKCQPVMCNTMQLESQFPLLEHSCTGVSAPQGSSRSTILSLKQYGSVSNLVWCFDTFLCDVCFQQIFHTFASAPVANLTSDGSHFRITMSHHDHIIGRLDFLS